MDLRTTTIDGKIVDIISEDKYRQKQSMYQLDKQWNRLFTSQNHI